MGIVQKIFYFHVPSGYAMYLGATACFVGSVGYLIKPSDTWDAFARAGAEAAVVFGAILLTTGPLWAAKAWGYYWTWDPRLTTSLLSFLVYVAYLVLRAFAGDGEGERKFSAALGILGAANLPIIHFSVKKWSGQHPQVITGNGGGLGDPRMYTALGVSFLTFTLFAAALIWARTRVGGRGEPPRTSGRRRDRSRPRRSERRMMRNDQATAPATSAVSAEQDPGGPLDDVPARRGGTEQHSGVDAPHRGVRRPVGHPHGVALLPVAPAGLARMRGSTASSRRSIAPRRKPRRSKRGRSESHGDARARALHLHPRGPDDRDRPRLHPRHALRPRPRSTASESATASSAYEHREQRRNRGSHDRLRDDRRATRPHRDRPPLRQRAHHPDREGVRPRVALPARGLRGGVEDRPREPDAPERVRRRGPQRPRLDVHHRGARVRLQRHPDEHDREHARDDADQARGLAPSRRRSTSGWLASEPIFASYATTEPGAGSDVAGHADARHEGRRAAATSSTARRRGSRTRTSPRFITIFATEDPALRHKGIGAFIVHKDAKGVKVGKHEDKLGQRASDTAVVMLEDVQVPAAQVLAPPGQGFKVAMETFNQTRPDIGAIAVGLMRRCLDECVAYAKERKTFGVPIAQHQLVQAMIAEMAIRIEATSLLVRKAAWNLDKGIRNPIVSSYAKAYGADCGDADGDRRRADLRRQRVREGVPGREADARREDSPDLRGDEPDPATRHREERPRRCDGVGRGGRACSPSRSRARSRRARAARATSCPRRTTSAVGGAAGAQRGVRLRRSAAARVRRAARAERGSARSWRADATDHLADALDACATNLAANGKLVEGTIRIDAVGRAGRRGRRVARDRRAGRRGGGERAPLRDGAAQADQLPRDRRQRGAGPRD